VNINELQAYSDAWNGHDIDLVMSYMTEDCVFETGGGSEHFGTRYEGFDVVKQRFVEVWTDIPDVQFTDTVHFVDGDRGCSQWTLTGTRPNGQAMKVDGCDLFIFSEGKIKLKNSFLKAVSTE
jgi:ketosteroid isomerase-like protein